MVLSHHHPDNVMNVGLFPSAWVHDYKVIYGDAQWNDRDADGYSLTATLKLIRTPGHSPQALLAGTANGIVAFVGTSGGGPTARCTTRSATLSGKSASGREVLALANIIVRGHRRALVPDASTLR